MINPFFLFLCALLLFFYVPLTLWSRHGFDLQLILRNALFLAAVGVLGLV
jgi:hypothetical protein